MPLAHSHTLLLSALQVPWGTANCFLSRPSGVSLHPDWLPTPPAIWSFSGLLRPLGYKFPAFYYTTTAAHCTTSELFLLISSAWCCVFPQDHPSTLNTMTNLH